MDTTWEILGHVYMLTCPLKMQHIDPRKVGILIFSMHACISSELGKKIWIPHVSFTPKTDVTSIIESVLASDNRF